MCFSFVHIICFRRFLYSLSLAMNCLAGVGSSYCATDNQATDQDCSATNECDPSVGCANGACSLIFAARCSVPTPGICVEAFRG